MGDAKCEMGDACTPELKNMKQVFNCASGAALTSVFVTGKLITGALKRVRRLF